MVDTPIFVESANKSAIKDRDKAGKDRRISAKAQCINGALTRVAMPAKSTDRPKGKTNAPPNKSAARPIKPMIKPLPKSTTRPDRAKRPRPKMAWTRRKAALVCAHEFGVADRKIGKRATRQSADAPAIAAPITDMARAATAHIGSNCSTAPISAPYSPRRLAETSGKRVAAKPYPKPRPRMPETSAKPPSSTAKSTINPPNGTPTARKARRLVRRCSKARPMVAWVMNKPTAKARKPKAVRLR